MKPSFNFKRLKFNGQLNINNEFNLSDDEYLKIDGSKVYIESKNFNNNLDVSVNNVQKLADFIDNAVFGDSGSGTVTSVNGYSPDESGNVQIPNIVQDANYVHSDNNYTTTDKSKVDNLPVNTNAELSTLQSINSTQSTQIAALQDELDYLEILTFSMI